MSDERSRPEKAEPRPGAPDRPASVRDAMRPAGRYDPERGRRSSARRRRPVPGRGAPPSARELTNPLAAREPTRQVELGEEMWTVFVKGSCTVGSGAGRGARVLSVGLRAPGERPDPEGTRYLVAGRLEDVDEDVLRGLVAEAGRGSRGRAGVVPPPREDRPASGAEEPGAASDCGPGGRMSGFLPPPTRNRPPAPGGPRTAPSRRSSGDAGLSTDR